MPDTSTALVTPLRTLRPDWPKPQLLERWEHEAAPARWSSWRGWSFFWPCDAHVRLAWRG